MIGRALWIIALIVIGCGTAALQLDRQARVSAGLATATPQPFRSFAQARITGSALASKDPEIALSEAQTLIRRRPIPAENMRLLAAAQFGVARSKGPRVDESALTMQYAAQRGWRDPLTQEAMMRLAMVSGDQSEAAKRFVALMLRPDTDDQVLIEAGSVIFDANSTGRATLTEVVSSTTRWHTKFIQRGLKVLPADAYVATLTEASRRGAAFDCRALQLSLQSIARRGSAAKSAAALQELIKRQCR